MYMHARLHVSMCSVCVRAHHTYVRTHAVRTLYVCIVHSACVCVHVSLGVRIGTAVGGSKVVEVWQSLHAELQ